MSATEFELDEITGFNVDPKTGAVVIEASGPGDITTKITFQFTAVTHLLTSIAACPVTEKGQPASEKICTLHPRSATPFELPNGEIGIAFQIADNMLVPMVIPAIGIQSLRNSVTRLEQLAQKHKQ